MNSSRNALLSRQRRLAQTRSMGAIMIDRRSGARYPSIGGIARLVPAEHYAANFGLQWNTFAATQLASVAGINFTFNTFWNNTLETARFLRQDGARGRARVPDASRELLETGARVISSITARRSRRTGATTARTASCCSSRATSTTCLSMTARSTSCSATEVCNTAPIRRAPLRRCSPRSTRGEAVAGLLPEGSVSHVLQHAEVPVAADHDAPFPERLFRLVSWYVPVWLPIDTVLKSIVFRIPRLGPMLAGLIPIPCWNYLRTGLSYRQRFEWAILGTFDALAARYDTPMTAAKVERMVAGPGRDVRISLGANSIVANIVKHASAVAVRDSTSTPYGCHGGLPREKVVSALAATGLDDCRARVTGKI